MITTTPRDVSWDVVATALERGGWACFCRPEIVDTIRVKAQKIARRLGVRIDFAYVDGRFAAMPRVSGECLRASVVLSAKRVEELDLEAVTILQRTVREQMLELAQERTG